MKKMIKILYFIFLVIAGILFICSSSILIYDWLTPTPAELNNIEDIAVSYTHLTLPTT